MRRRRVQGRGDREGQSDNSVSLNARHHINIMHLLEQRSGDVEGGGQ